MGGKKQVRKRSKSVKGEVRKYGIEKESPVKLHDTSHWKLTELSMSIARCV